MSDPRQRAARLSCWRGDVDPKPIGGGITNANFLVDDNGERYFVRIGEDIPLHGIMRFNELAASRAAHAAGISPEVVHAEPGALVLRYIEGRTLEPAEIRDPDQLARIVALVRHCHYGVARHLRGPVLAFWVFHVLRDYAARLRQEHSRMAGELPRLERAAATLEQALGAVHLVFGHNDLLAANFIDDGQRLWLIDWDYAGFNTPLFDLANLASNNELAPEQERWLLDTYFGEPASDALWRRYAAMKCASLLRESLWSMVSEIHSTLDFDYAAYTTENLARFDAVWEQFQSIG